MLIRHSAVELRRVHMDREPESCVGDTVRKIGEEGERELVLVVSVKCGKE